MASPSDSEKRHLDRRSYLKLAGTAVAAAGGAGITTGQSAEQNIVEAGADDTGNQPIDGVLNAVAGPGQEIYFPPGTYLLNSLTLNYDNLTLRGEDATLVATPRSSTSTFVNVSGNGWVVDGFTIDYTQTSEPPRGQVSGANWEFRNCRFKGRQYTDIRGGSALSPRIPAGATGLIENVDFTDGAGDPGGPGNRKAIWFGGSASNYTVAGDITIRGCSFRHWAENTIYGHKAGGHVLIEDCTFEDTNVAGTRIGGGTTVRNCVFKQTGLSPRQGWSGGLTQRGIWVTATNGDAVTIEGCDFIMSSDGAGSAIHFRESIPEVTIRDCRIRQEVNSPAITIPAGSSGVTVEGVSITGSASAPAISVNGRNGSTFRDLCIEQAGSGIELANSGQCEVLSSTINVDGQAMVLSGSSLATEDFSKSGSCPLPSTDANTDETDSDEPTTDETDTDEPTTTTDSTDTESADSTDSPHVLTVDGTGQTSETTYQFSVSGSVEKSTDGGASVDSEDTIDGKSVSGSVVNWLDSYQYDGEITDFTIDGPASVSIDGETVDPETIGPVTPEKTLRIEGGTARRWTYYDFTVDGTLVKAEVDGATINDGDTISGSSAEGFVAGGTDAYHFSGELTEFNLDGPGEVFLDGTPLDTSTVPSSQLPNTLIIDATDATGASEYTFEVDGEIAKSRSLGTVTAEDIIDGQSVSGYVNNGKDGYRYSGNITQLSLTGSATVAFEDNDG